MGIFNFSRPAANNGSEGQDIQLLVNEETVTVSAAEAAGKTVSELFQQFAAGICDVSRINRFVAEGRVVCGSATVEAGTIYRGAIASESKG